MGRLVGRLLLFAAGAAAACWAWNTWREDEAPVPTPEPDPMPEPEEAVTDADEAPTGPEADAPEADEPGDVEPEEAVEAPVEPDEPEPQEEPEAENRAPEPLDDDNRPPEPLELRGIAIPDPEALVRYANEASETALTEAGLGAAARKVVLDQRPFATAGDLASTRGIGPKTLEALVAAC